MVELSAKSLELVVGQQVLLTANSVPGNQDIIWLSSNTGIANISGNVVTAYAYGTADLTAQFVYNGKVYSEVCKVTVVSQQEIADKAAAQQVSDLIAALPQVITLETKGTVEAVRTAYNQLTKKQQALVVGYDVLLAAEEILAKLEEAPNDTPESPTDVPETPTVLLSVGDLTGDEKINAKDALEVLKAAVEKVQLSDEQKVAADVNKDGNINAKDALEILKHSVGKPSALDK